MSYCQGCLKAATASGFCLACRAELHQTGHHVKPGQVGGLFQYGKTLRRVIMRAKVKNDLHALNGLSALYTGHEDVLRAAAKCDVIVPAASSLWGRIRGRFDLAQAMALNLGSETGKPVVLLPWQQYMRLTKRAGKNRSLVIVAKKELAVKNHPKFSGQRILLIDDIITTGLTVKSTSKSLLAMGATSVTAISLAASSAADNSQK